MTSRQSTFESREARVQRLETKLAKPEFKWIIKLAESMCIVHEDVRSGQEMERLGDSLQEWLLQMYSRRGIPINDFALGVKAQGLLGLPSIGSFITSNGREIIMSELWKSVLKRDMAAFRGNAQNKDDTELIELWHLAAMKARPKARGMNWTTGINWQIEQRHDFFDGEETQ